MENPDNLKIEEVQFSSIVFGRAMRILWSSDKGFGNYTITINANGDLEGDSEYMDTNEDKKFITRLIGLLIRDLKIK